MCPDQTPPCDGDAPIDPRGSDDRPSEGSKGAKRPEPARDVAAAIVRAALVDGRIRLARAGRQVTVAFGDEPATRVLPADAKSTRALSVHLRELFAAEKGLQPSDSALRVMREIVLAAASRVEPDALPCDGSPDPATAEREADEDEDGGVEFEREPSGRTSQADGLVEFIDMLGVTFWHTPGGDLFATTVEDGRSENRPVGSKDFRRWIQARYFAEKKKAVRREALAEALGVCEGRAMTGPEQVVFVRLAGHDGNIYVDLGDRDRRVVEVTSTGWRLTTDAPVRFRRPPGMLPLPVPARGGDIELLRPLVNVPDDDGWILFVAFLFSALHPRGPFGVLVILGEAGSAKTTMAKIVVAILDPKDAPLRRPPREERDLAIAARHGRIVAFNNLSRIPDYLSDGICSIATDGGSVFRTLYSDEEETRFSERRPVILNGIEDFVVRGDLADRSLKLTLKAIGAKKRLTEAAVLASLEQLLPRILGALLDAVVVALANEPFVTLPEVPRLADLARWVVAAETAFGWAPGSFLAAYRRALGASSVSMLDDSAVARCIVKLVAHGPWRGSATELLAALGRVATEEERDAKTWPSSARAISGEVRRLATDLRRVGYVIDDDGKDPVTRRAVWSIAPPSERTSSVCDPSDASDASDRPVAAAANPSETEGSTVKPPSNDPGDTSATGSPGGAEASATTIRSVGSSEPSDVGALPTPVQTSSEGSKRPKGEFPPVSAPSLCAACGRDSAWEGRHVENCPTCGPTCSCPTCTASTQAPHA